MCERVRVSFLKNSKFGVLQKDSPKILTRALGDMAMQSRLTKNEMGRPERSDTPWHRAA
jgi:hypothetical protein